MRLAPGRRRVADDLAGVVGVARVDRRAAGLVGRLAPGDIAVIDHPDLDRMSAEALAAARPAAVVNAAPFLSGRYPALGARVLLDAGITMLEDCGPAAAVGVRDGQTVRVHEDGLYVGTEQVARGRLVTEAGLQAATEDALHGLASQAEAIAAGTAERLRREPGLFTEAAGLPRLATPMAGRPVLVVTPGPQLAEDLTALRRFIRAERPVVVAVDDAAVALVDAGIPPDVLLGDLVSVPDALLASGAELVVRVGPDGTSRGVARVKDLELAALPVSSGLSADDLAIVMADVAGASLVVVAGIRTRLVDLLDRGRGGTAGTFATRLRVGGHLVETPAAVGLYRRRTPGWAWLTAALCLLLAAALVVGFTPAGRFYRDYLAGREGDAQAKAEAAVARSQAAAGRADALIGQLAPAATAAQLAGHRVVVVTLPDTPDAARDAATAAVRTAGATVTGVVAVQPLLVERGNDDAVAGAVTRIAPLGVGQPAPGARPVPSAAAYLSFALLDRPGVPPLAASTAQAVLAEMVQSGLVAVSAPPSAVADLAVVIGPASDIAARRDGSVQVVAALGARGTGAVLASPEPNQAAGLRTAARAASTAQAPVSTDDDLATSAGRVVLVAALAALPGTSGPFGISADTQTMPALPAS